ncbi:MAG: peptidoglycan DD-metalloendopeptidase family protein [Anaerolineales bacterium]|nr:peptidoglycan DD-metalloendopeptidase family protein [Anaerolineales bacterium]
MTDPTPTQSSPLARIWRDIVAAGWREPLLRFGAHGLILLLLAGGVWLGRLPIVGLSPLNVVEQLDSSGQAFVPAATPTPVNAGVVVTAAAPPHFGQIVAEESALDRQVNPQTLFPERTRGVIETVVVAPGDTLSGIAARFNIDIATLLWANADVLNDDVHALRAGQALQILPVDGVFHIVAQGEDLEAIARAYGVTPQIIVEYRENGLTDASAVTRLSAGQQLIIPGGRRALTLWTIPSLPRGRQADPDASFGECAGGYTGAVGTGTLIWPAESRALDGYPFSVVHLGMDLRAAEGDPVLAADAGVVMYAGPNDRGYGNLVVLDHGNGYETAYAELSAISVACGQSVLQGNVLGAAGNSGRSEHPNLHFEVHLEGQPVDPRPLLP